MVKQGATISQDAKWIMESKSIATCAHRGRLAQATWEYQHASTQIFMKPSAYGSASYVLNGALYDIPEWCFAPIPFNRYEPPPTYATYLEARARDLGSFPDGLEEPDFDLHLLERHGTPLRVHQFRKWNQLYKKYASVLDIAIYYTAHLEGHPDLFMGYRSARGLGGRPYDMKIEKQSMSNNFLFSI